MFVYREAYYLKSRKPEEGDTHEFVKWQEKMIRIENLAEVMVEKHRHGQTRSIELVFEGNFTRFSNKADDRYTPH